MVVNGERLVGNFFNENDADGARNLSHVQSHYILVMPELIEKAQITKPATILLQEVPEDV